MWSQLRDPEVLRVGIGKAAPSLAERVYLDPMDDAPENEVDRSDVAPEQTEDYRDGFSEAKLAMRQQLRNLRAEALTAERQNAYDRAIAVVKEIQP